MINKHKHADLICAKANNMDLVTIVKDSDGKWRKIINQKMVDFHNVESGFLCLPKHEEVCLHWLNGGLAQIESTGDYGWCEIARDSGKEWSLDSVFMSKGHNSRVKPRRAKRWIVYNAEEDNLVSNRLFETKDEAVRRFGHYVYLQYVEIEVEVE